MTKKLEELFDLPTAADDEIEEADAVDENPIQEYKESIQTMENEITISEKINSALEQVRGMEAHDDEMDEISAEAIESYKQLMALGFNITDMAAGPIFNNAAAMLKIALEARDSKVTRKLKQIDLMLKKANLDARKAKAEPETDDDEKNTQSFDRNELLRIMLEQNKKN